MLGAGVGAAARYRLDRAISRRASGALPLGTFTINVLGAFLLGIVVGAEPAAGVAALVGTGFCGGFTTFSTFSYEAVRLLQAGDLRPAFTYVAASLAFGMLAAIPGYWLGVVVWGAQAALPTL